METQIIEGKIVANLEDLHEWENNPRSVDEAGLARLIDQIKKFGIYKPIICMADGTVLGGNMRLRALKTLDYKQIWVSIVEPASDAEMIEIALSDNDRVGFYVEDKLLELIESAPDLDLKTFQVDLGKAINLEDFKNFRDSVQPKIIGDMTLPSGEKSPYEQMTFILAPAQAENVKQAMAKAKEQGEFFDENENANGNALNRVCEQFNSKL